MKFKTFYNLFDLQKRVLIAIIAVLTLFFALVCRIFYLQIIKNRSLQILACEQWLRDLPLSSKRGEIYDCSGVSIATTVTTYDVYVRARNVTDPNLLASRLSETLNIDRQVCLGKVTNKRVSEVLIKMQVDEARAKSLKDIDGVYLSQNVARVYPYSNLFTQVLGYCTIDNAGQAGLELYYDKYLRGVDGKSLTQTNAQGKEIDNSLKYFIPSIAGANLTTTLDVQMQTILERNLQQAYEENKALGTTGIILNAQTGGILAMSCVPNFDLNSVPRDNLSELQKTTKNTTVVDIYEPGSTFKIVTLAGALNEGLTNPEERFFCGGRCTVDGETIRCWKSTGHGSQTLTEAFKSSCNCVFVNLALRLGVEKFYHYLNLFGVGEKTGVDIASESNGMIMDKKQVKVVDLARIGFGHAIAVTGLQMAELYAKITSGKNTTPHLLSKLETENGKCLYKTSNNSSSLSLKESTIKTVNEMLFNNVNSEEKCSFVAGYSVGGKTGTAQKYDSNGQIASGKYISSFIGTYPAENPKYILIVCINEPSNGAYYGGVVAKPVGQRIFSEIFETKAIPCGNEEDRQIVPTITMPDLVGKKISDACSELKMLGLDANFETDGDTVLSQMPEKGTKLFAGEIVFLVTN